MAHVNLDEEEWQKVMACLATAPWNVANPLLMKMGEQLRAQKNSGTLPPIEEKEINLGVRGRGKSS